jgi:lysozyme
MDNYLGIMGTSPQLKARSFTDPIRELYRSKIARLEALAYPVVGVDVSYWQGAIDWTKLACHAYFAFIRAGRGNADYDTRYSEYLDGAHKAGRAVGLYWYMQPRTGTANFKQHVDNFASRYKGSASQLPPVFDVEENGGMSRTELTGWIQKAVARFQEWTGVSPMIYTSPGFWNANTYRNDWAKTLPLWDAHWTTADEPVIPNDWGAINNPKTWTFWQHSSKGNGADYGASSTNIDLNRYHYSLAQFNAQFGTSLKPLEPEQPPPPPPEPTHDEQVKIMWAYGKGQGWWT